ncbi:sensor histidine kinase [Flavobacteriaceae bacterium AU392]|nr:sensor histidine kinase [Flavobacteriaceae bacterium]RKM83574.1 sensor histidine kinase [Flavobacteriaceae bacterium AU392]
MINKYIITFFIFCVFLIAQIFLFIDYIKSLIADIEKSIDCLLYDDYSISISKRKRKNSLYHKTALLIKKYKERDLKQSSEQLIFTNIIESLTIGTLILRKDSKNLIEVYQLNDTFTGFLKIPKYYKWELLKEKIKPLIDLIDQQSWKKQRKTISLNINDQAETFYLKTSVTKTYNFEYLIITLETIQQVIDKKEKESWYKLMNVMSHEIINTITPISTLASNLNSLLQEEPDKEALDELSQGLQIINRRSLHLTNFVDTYRTLTELPLPEKEQTNINQLIKNTLVLFKQEFEENNVTVIFDNSEHYILNIDKKQIEQVFINLISNSLNAIKDQLNISIEVKQINNKINIYFSDNGIGISEDIKDNIFVPYFTTRKGGSGIGLTLTKSIMESHGGTIYFKPEKEKTMFVLSFIL